MLFALMINCEFKILNHYAAVAILDHFVSAAITYESNFVDNQEVNNSIYNTVVIIKAIPLSAKHGFKYIEAIKIDLSA